MSMTKRYLESLQEKYHKGEPDMDDWVRGLDEWIAEKAQMNRKTRVEHIRENLGIDTAVEEDESVFEYKFMEN